jgi:hypothetical protein
MWLEVRVDEFLCCIQSLVQNVILLTVHFLVLLKVVWEEWAEVLELFSPYFHLDDEVKRKENFVCLDQVNMIQLNHSFDLQTMTTTSSEPKPTNKQQNKTYLLSNYRHQVQIIVTEVIKSWMKCSYFLCLSSSE